MLLLKRHVFQTTLIVTPTKIQISDRRMAEHCVLALPFATATSNYTEIIKGTDHYFSDRFRVNLCIFSQVTIELRAEEKCKKLKRKIVFSDLDNLQTIRAINSLKTLWASFAC